MILVFHVRNQNELSRLIYCSSIFNVQRFQGPLQPAKIEVIMAQPWVSELETVASMASRNRAVDFKSSKWSKKNFNSTFFTSSNLCHVVFRFMHQVVQLITDREVKFENSSSTILAVVNWACKSARDAVLRSLNPICPAGQMRME